MPIAAKAIRVAIQGKAAKKSILQKVASLLFSELVFQVLGNIRPVSLLK